MISRFLFFILRQGYFLLLGTVSLCCCVNCVAAEAHLFLIHVDGTGLRQFTSLEGRYYGSPDWSPDGQWVAYDTWLSEEKLTDSKICVVRANGKDSKIIGHGAMPSWSPDGKQLVCHTYDSPQTIDVINADGTGRETILNRWGSPRWSPKHDRIASLGGSGRSIYFFDLRTGNEWSLPRGPYSPKLGFSISPNGSRFCFGDSRGGVAVATLHEASRETDVKWLVKTGATSHTSWSPDGMRVVFEWHRPKDPFIQLYIKEVDSDDPPQRLPGQDPNRHNANPDWSPDGKSILFCSFPASESP